MKIKSPIYHLAFWVLTYLFWVFIIGDHTLKLSHAITVEFCLLIFIAGNYYFNTQFTIPYLLNKKRYFYFGLCFIGGVLLGAVLRVPVSYMVSRDLFKTDISKFNYVNVFWDSLINILFWVVLIVGAKLAIEKIRSQRYIEQIENEKAINELNFLRAQFNPHFLFNSINSIYAHIDKSNKQARNMLLVFSDMLRYQLYECNVEHIALDKEISYIKNYITLQKSRLDDRIQVYFCVDELNSNIQIAPLILITFIENAFKHIGFDENKENHISMKLHHDEWGLVFTISNTKDNNVSRLEGASGLGIANAKRRLELLYPGKHTLQIDDQENNYSVSLTLFDI